MLVVFRWSRSPIASRGWMNLAGSILVCSRCFGASWVLGKRYFSKPLIERIFHELLGLEKIEVDVRWSRFNWRLVNIERKSYIDKKFDHLATKFFSLLLLLLLPMKNSSSSMPRERVTNRPPFYNVCEDRFYHGPAWVIKPRIFEVKENFTKYPGPGHYHIPDRSIYDRPGKLVKMKCY